jgi:hypothetical protein
MHRPRKFSEIFRICPAQEMRRVNFGFPRNFIPMPNNSMIVALRYSCGRELFIREILLMKNIAIGIIAAVFQRDLLVSRGPGACLLGGL